MKKYLCIFLMMIFSLMFISCSSVATSGDWQNPDNDSDRPINNDANILVVYFSAPDNKDNSYIEIEGQRLGNTQYMAYVIQEKTNANIFRILPKNPYPTDHQALLKVAQEERKTNARPEILDEIESFNQYDTIFIGYPNWNSDLPNIMYTFFETYDFSGKTIIPFNSHGGSGFSGTRETISRLEPNATMKEGLSISRNNIDGCQKTIEDWLIKLGYKVN